MVYFWVIPYFLICIGGAVLLNRLSPRKSVLVNIGAALASATVLWLYVNGILYPAPGPLSALPYVMIGTVAVFLVGFVASVRSKRRTSISA
ncbi:hypothetical protein NicSoilE8_42600 (plasmid) [Arthrobacter sp. NicSoilE8]|nr:hypothetical protein NicSoilE8_42600 [Arthrobacter sp. NicSoilE8]